MRIIKCMFGWVVLLEQVLGIGAFIYAATLDNTELALLILGQYLLITGIAAFSNDHKIGIALMTFGTLFFVVGSLLKWGYILDKTFDREKLIGNIIIWSFIIVFIVFGLTFMVRPLYLKRKMKYHTLKIPAEVIDYETWFDEDGKTYCPIFQYTYNNQVYKYSNHWFANIEIPQKGSKIDIYLNPNDASDAFVPTGKTINIFLPLFGTVFFCLGIFVLVLVIFNQCQKI